MQKQRVEEADGAGHLVGENQPPLGSTQGVSGVGRASPTPAGLTHPCRAHPPRAARGAKGRQVRLLQRSGWELGAAGMLGNGAPVWPRPESTVNNRAVTETDRFPLSRVTQPLLTGPGRGSGVPGAFQTGLEDR